MKFTNAGLYFDLGAYKYHVFVDFRQISDNEWGQYAQLHHYLQGRGVPNIDEAIKEIFLQPVHYPFRELVNPGMFAWLQENLAFASQSDEVQIQAAILEAQQKMGYLIREINQHIGLEADDQLFAEKTRNELDTTLHLPQLIQELPKKARNLITPKDDSNHWNLLFSWIFTHNLGETFGEDADNSPQSRSLLDEWLLGKIVAQTLVELQQTPEKAQKSVDLLKILVAQQNWYARGAVKKKKADKLMKHWLKDPEIQAYLRINRYEGILWFNEEAFDQLTRGLLSIAVIRLNTESDLSPKQIEKRTNNCIKIIHRLRKASNKSEYQVKELIRLVE